MNSKKILALLCATAMASSTLVPVMAGAETAELSDATVLWSDTFDAYENDPEQKTGGFGGPALVVAKKARDSYAAIDGVTLFTTNRDDDSSYFITEAFSDEDATDLVLTTNASRFSTAGRGAYIAFDEAYAPTSSESLVLSTKVKIVETDHTYAPAFAIGDVVISNTLMGVESGAWVDLKVALKPDGTYEVLADGTAVKTGSAASRFHRR